MRAVKGPAKSSISDSGFWKKGIMDEGPAKALGADELRMMLVRNEMDSVVSSLQPPGENIMALATLLLDDKLAVAPLAAEALGMAAAGGLDISPAVPSLMMALGDKYAKAEAARTLARHHLNRANIGNISELLAYPDAVVRDAVREVCGDVCDALKT
jgi:hypothetical protein